MNSLKYGVFKYKFENKQTLMFQGFQELFPLIMPNLWLIIKAVEDE
ncbi:hypothetical protein N752_08980 [Desulforamulus aquiferis]|nr:hypothetical protein N752_08980 [Desulforamulus aquiferis]